MHLKRTTVRKNGKVYEYAKIVQSFRRGDGQSTERVVENLGRMKSEEDWDWAESVLEAMKREEEVPEAKGLEIEEQLELGGIWASEELWEKCGIRSALLESIEGRRVEFSFERIAFLLAVNRLYSPSSDLSAHRWINERVYPREEVEKQWIYRSLDLLAEEKDGIEKKLFENLVESLDLSLELVFYDLTSTFFHGAGPGMAEHGFSKDKRPDRVQIVLGVVMADGIPIAHEVWSGDTVDKSTLEETVEQMKDRLEIGKMVFVADRGVISTPNLEELEDVGYEYILSTKRRKDNLAEKLLVRSVPGSEKLRAEEVRREEVDDTVRRYILCLNEETRRSRLETLNEIREETEERLQDLAERYEKSRSGRRRGRPMTKEGTVKQVQKILGRNKRLFKFSVDKTIEWKLKREAWKYERAIAGKFLLVTTSDLKPHKAMESYKDLKDVERAFDELKNFLMIRPIFHWTDKRVGGHVFVCILALLLKRLMEREADEPLTKIMRELEKLKANVVEFRGRRFLQRNRIDDQQEQVLKSIGVMKPPKILEVETKD